MKKIFYLLMVAAVGMVSQKALTLETGDVAPAFEMSSTQGNIRLSDYQGNKNVVIAFYYADFSPV